MNIVRSIGPEGLERILSLGVLGEQAQLLHLISNLSGIVNDHLMGFFFTQVAELFQHFVGGLKVQGGLIVAVVKALTGLNDRPVNGVVGVEEMHVSRSDYRQPQFLAQLDDGAVQIPQTLIILDLSFTHQESVIADGLNLQIIIEAGDLLQLFPAFSGKHGTEEFAGFAGAAENQPFPVLFNDRSGHMGLPAEVLQMTDGNETVQVFHALLCFY